MKKDRTKVRQLKQLRNQAEKLLRGRAEDIQGIPGDDIQKLVHELQVYQIELEMQNEELRKAQVELEESRNRYYDLYDFAPIGYFTFDQKGLILEVNLAGADLLGVERRYLMKMAFSRFVAPEDQALFSFHRNKVSESKARQTCKLKLAKRGGTPFYAQLESIAAHDTEGNFNQLRTAITDITDLKRAEEALKEYSGQLEEKVEERTRELQDAQERLVYKEKLAVLGQLAGGMSHELRNPLGAIKNAAYFLNMALEKPEPEVKEAVEILEREVRTSEKIINSLLGFAQRKPPTLRKLKINDVLKETLSRTPVPDLPAAPNAAQAGKVQVVCHSDETLPTILADSEQLSQAFGNLIFNAIQAMTEGGQLTIKTKAENPKWVTVSIADTGVGIPREKLVKIFEPLFTTKAKGIGLGLALTKTLVEGHGGTIEVESEEGKGSTFIVRLPISGD
jgi:PAS domain S-box-containing protein